MTMNALISVVAPVHNDADIIEQFVSETHRVLQEHYAHFEIIIVDDGSTDDTAEIIRALLTRCDFTRAVRLSRHFGKDVALSVGLDSAIGDYVVTMLADSDPPALIPGMVARARAGADLVQGVWAKKQNRFSIRRLGARFFYWYVQRVLGIDLPADTTEFRCLTRRVVNAIAQVRGSIASVRVLMTYVGYTRVLAPYEPISRRQRTPVRSLRNSVRLAIDTVVENSAHPLRLVSGIAVFAAVLNVIYAVYVLVIYLTRENVEPGWASLSMQSAVQFFFISLVLAGIAEYTGRILVRSGDRPRYYIRDEMNSSVLLRIDQHNVVSSHGEVRGAVRG